MTAVLERPTTSSREEALATDVHYAERRAIAAEAKAHEAVRRALNATKDADAYKNGLAQLQEELIALRLRERELEAQNGMLLRLLARHVAGIKPRAVPTEPNGRRYMVLRAQRLQSHRQGHQGNLVDVRHERRMTLLALQFADGRKDDFLPSELIDL